MLSTLSRHPDHQHTFRTQYLRPSATRRWESDPKSRTRHKSFVRPSGFRRMVKEFFAKATSNTSSQHSNPTYILIVREPASEKQDQDGNPSHTHSPPTGAKNDRVTQELAINVLPSQTTANEPSLSTNSLEMNSKGTRNTSVSLRNSSNQSSYSSTNEYLAQKKRDAINRLMEALEEWLYTDPPFTCHAPGATGSGSSSASDNGSSLSGGKAPSRLSGQKRSLRRDSFDGSDPNGDGNEDDKRGNKRSKVELPNTPKLACPFFKQDPARYKDRGACTGPGWNSPARLKEHIYRSHRQPSHICNRCYETFQNGDKLKEHQRADVSCKVSEPKPLEGITEDQYQQLRKKTTSTKTSAERWEEVYRIIFPNATMVPSPYYEYDDGKHPAGCDNEFDVRDELLTRVRTALEVRFDKFEEEARTQLVDIVRDELGHIREEYCQLKLARPETKKGTTPADTTKGSAPTETGTANELGDFDFDILLEHMDGPHLGFNGDPMMGGIGDADCGFPSDLSDSAYWSGTADSPRSYTKE